MQKKSAGFTLVELLIVIAITSILAVGGTITYSNLRAKKALDSITTKIIFDLRATSVRSKVQQDDMQWGIRFTNGATDYYEIWSGNSYATGTKLSKNILVLTAFSDPTEGAFKDIVFARGTGLPTGGAVSIAIGSYIGSKQIAINELGTVVSGDAESLAVTPGAPTSLSAASGDTQTRLTWVAPESTGWEAITNYNVYRSGPNNNSSYVLVSSGGCAGLGVVLTCTDSSLSNGDTYYYKVRALSSVGEGIDSNEGSTTPNSMVQRYWVGGSGSWSDSANHWSSFSGGAPGAPMPTSTNDAIFDLNSFVSPGQVVTVDSPVNIKSIDWTGATNNPTWAGTAAMNIAGSFKLVAGMTRTYTGPITFSSVVADNDIDTAGIALASDITFNNAAYSGGADTWTLQNNGLVTGVTNATWTSGTTSSGSARVWNVSDTTSIVIGMTIALANNTGCINSPVGTVTGVTSTTVTLTISTGSGGSACTSGTAILSANTISLVRGGLNTNSQPMTAWKFISMNTSTAIRTLTLGSSAITIKGFTTSYTTTSLPWDTRDSIAQTNVNYAATGLTVNPGTSTITFTNSGPSYFALGSKNYYNVNFAGTAQSNLYGANTFLTNSAVSFTNPGTAHISTTNTFYDLKRIGNAVKTDTFNLGSNQTINGTLTLTGNSLINRLLVLSNGTGGQRVLTAPNVYIENVDFRDIGSAGAWTGTKISIGDMGGNSTTISGLASVRTLYWVGGTGSWSSSAHWASTSGGQPTENPPLPQDAVVFDNNSGTGTVTADMPVMGKNLDFSSLTNAITLAFNASGVNPWIVGDNSNGLRLGSGLTISGTNTVTLYTRDIFTFETAGRAWTAPIVIESTTPTWSSGTTTFGTGRVWNVGALSGIRVGNVVTLIANTGCSTSPIGTVTAVGASTITVDITTGSAGGACSGGTQIIGANSAIGPKVVLGSNPFSSSSSFGISRGTFDTNNQNMSQTVFSSTSQYNLRSLFLGTSIITLTSTTNNAIVWDTANAGSTGNGKFTIIGGESTIAVNGTNNTTKKIRAGDDNVTYGRKTFGNLTLNGGTNVQYNFAVPTVYPGATNKMTLNGAFTANGTGSGTSAIKLRSDVSGIQWLISANTASVSNLDIQYSNVSKTGGGTSPFVCGPVSSCANSGNNTGWTY